MPKPRRYRRRDEDQLQFRIVGALRLSSLLFCHVANERKASDLERAKLWRMGVVSGVPDLLIFTPPPLIAYRGVALELKSPTGSPSKTQLLWEAGLRDCGWAYLRSSDYNQILAWLRIDLGYHIITKPLDHFDEGPG